MRKSSIVFIIILLSHTGYLFGEYGIYCRDEFSRGEVITVLLAGSEFGIDSVPESAPDSGSVPEEKEILTLALIDSSGKVQASSDFFPLKIKNFEGLIGLLGIDSTLSPGNYLLSVRGLMSVEKYSREILISGNEFKSETIKLDEDNSALRTDPDPAIVEEAMFIHAIYANFRSFSFFGSTDLMLPFPDGIRTSWYGDRRTFLYSDGNKSGSIHSGIDFAAPLGTKITAAAGGQIVFAGNRIITGNTVVVEYLPGVYGVFFHMDEIFVSSGDSVTWNTVIGTLGSSGLATGPHLHWEVRVGGVSVNPDFLLSTGLIDNSLILSIVGRHTSE